MAIASCASIFLEIRTLINLDKLNYCEKVEHYIKLAEYYMELPGQTEKLCQTISSIFCLNIE